MRKAIHWLLFSVLVLGLHSKHVRAQVTFVLSPSPAVRTGPGTIDFEVTLTNSGTETLNLFVGFGSVPIPELTWDDLTFNANLPDTLVPSSAYTGRLSLLVGMGTPVGSYDVEYGVFGVGAITGNTVLPFSAVTIQVLEGMTIASEPSGLALLGGVLPAGYILAWGGRRRLTHRQRRSRTGIAALSMLAASVLTAILTRSSWAADRDAETLRERIVRAFSEHRSFSCTVHIVPEKRSAESTKASETMGGYRVQVAVSGADQAHLLYMDNAKAFRTVAGKDGWQVIPLRGVAGKTISETRGRAAVDAAWRECGLADTVLYELGRLSPDAPGISQWKENGVDRVEGVSVRKVTWQRDNGEIVLLDLGEADLFPRRAKITGGKRPRTENYTVVNLSPGLADSLFVLRSNERVARAIPASVIAKTPISRPTLAANFPLPERSNDAPSPVADALRDQLFDFGRADIAETNEITHEFPLRNTSDKPLSITRLAASCGCASVVAVRPDATASVKDPLPPGVVAILPPGEETRIRATVRTRGLRAGRITKSISVYALGWSQPVARLALAGELVGTAPPPPVPTVPALPVVPPSAASTAASTGVGPGIGTVAPDFTLHDLAGIPRSLNDVRGTKGTALFFFCGCEACYETARAWAARYGTLPQGTRTVIIYTEMEATSAKSLAAAAGLDLKSKDLTILLDPKRTVAEGLYHAEPCPRVVVLDGRKTILAAPVAGAMATLAEKSLRTNP